MAEPKTPLRYPGGKTRALDFIAAKLPTDSITEYREGFVGGGSVAFHLSQKLPNASVWINDLYQPLVSFWRTLQAHPVLLRDRVLAARDACNGSYDESAKLFTHYRDEIHADETSDLERAVGFYIINRTSFSGLSTSGGWSKQAAERWLFIEKHTDWFEKFSQRMANWKITQGSYETLVKTPWTGAGLLFLDPPYNLLDINADRLYGFNGKTHKGFDHLGMRDMLVDYPQRAMITYNEHETISALYSDWNCMSWDLDYTMVSQKAYREEQKKRKELLILNYDPPAVSLLEPPKKKTKAQADDPFITIGGQPLA